MRLVQAKRDFNFVPATSINHSPTEAIWTLLVCCWDWERENLAQGGVACWFPARLNILLWQNLSFSMFSQAMSIHMTKEQTTWERIPLPTSLCECRICVFMKSGNLCWFTACWLNTIPFRNQWSDNLGWVTQAKIIIAQEREVFVELKWKFIFQLHGFLLFNSLCPVLPKCKAPWTKVDWSRNYHSKVFGSWQECLELAAFKVCSTHFLVSSV